jgi:tetratricopeptide (TPR) repeat protein
MKFPKNIERFTLQYDANEYFSPIGYIAIEETSDGGGDYYGLYWEVGKEENSPTICASRHEDRLLVPEFKDFESFVEWFDETSGQEAPVMNLNDNDFFISLTNKGKVLTRNGRNEEAIQKLERAVSLFSEYSETWYWLAENYYQTGKKDQGDRAILNSIASNFFFGPPPRKAIERFNQMTPSDDLKDHPIVKRRERLIGDGNFTKAVSVNLGALLETIDELKKQKDYRSAILMQQNYGLLMASESEEVMTLHGFDRSTWFESFRTEVFSLYPNRKFQW